MVAFDEVTESESSKFGACCMEYATVRGVRDTWPLLVVATV